MSYSLNFLPGLRELREMTLGNPDVGVAIIDSEIDLSHPCFAGAELSEQRPNWLPPGQGWGWHGTHVASIVFGQPNSESEGLAPACRGLSVPIFAEGENGEIQPCSQLDLARAISIARGEGVDIINVSGGEAAPEGVADPLLIQAIKSCLRKDVLIVAAVGNDGDPRLHVPASLDGVLAVGGADCDGVPLQFSNWGGGHRTTGVMAPGQDILGAMAGGGTNQRSGTSFATPIVTSVIALLWSLLKGQKSARKLADVYEAIVATAIPCGKDEPEDSCNRMLNGRLNIPGAYQKLFGAPLMRASSAVMPAASNTRPARSAHVQRHFLPNAIPQPEARRTDAMSDETGFRANESAEASIGELGKLISKLEGLMAASAVPPTPPSPPRDQKSAQSPTEPVVADVAPSSAERVDNRELAKTRPSDCDCGGGNVRPPEKAEVPTALLPENDFITFRNSQLVFATGDIGYDFGTEARRDYFVQQFQLAFSDDRLREAAGVTKGNIPLPENYKAMAVYLNAGRIDPIYNAHQADSNALIWTMNIETIPVYEIRPMGNFDLIIFLTLIEFLRESADGEAERISVAGRVIGSKRLYNGTTVPSIEPSLRGMANWKPALLIDALIDQFKSEPETLTVLDGEGEEQIRDRVRNFLDRVYFELRNMGQAPDERAINYLATNAFDAGEVFIEAARERLELSSISAEQSTICRPESLCYDVLLSFFDPEKRYEKAKKLFRRTIDVSDVVPVNVGALRSWYVYE